MTDVLRLVHRLRERAHHQRFDEGPQERVAYARRNLRQVPGADLLRYLQPDAEHGQRRLQVVELALLRRRVHAMQGRNVQAVQLLGDRHVGQHHAFLDQLVGLVARLELNPAHLLLLTEGEVRFRRVEIQCAAARAGLEQRVINLDQGL